MEEVEEDDEEPERKPSNGFFGQPQPQAGSPAVAPAATVVPAAVSLTPIRGVGELERRSGSGVGERELK